MEDKFLKIIEAYNEGNQNNFIQSVKALGRWELLKFIVFMSEAEVMSEGSIIKVILRDWKLK